MSDLVKHNLDQFGRALGEYAKLSRKTPEQVLYKKGRDVSIELYRAFRDLKGGRAAQRVAIYDQLAARKWALGPIGEIARRFARNYMGDAPAIVGRVFSPGPGTVDIRSARIGGRGKRIFGGRRGRGGRAATLAEYSSLEFNKRYAPDALADEHVLNRRNVEIFFETMLRLRGAGSLAMSWLFRTWRKKVGDQPFAVRTLTNVNPKAEVKLQGQVDFQSGAVPTVTIASKMPGVSKFPATIALALRNATADMETYIFRKLHENAQKARLAA